MSEVVAVEGACVWRDGVCQVRASLHRAVVQSTRLPGSTVEAADARRRAFIEANRALSEHHCGPMAFVPGDGAHVVAGSPPTAKGEAETPGCRPRTPTNSKDATEADVRSGGSVPAHSSAQPGATADALALPDVIRLHRECVRIAKEVGALRKPCPSEHEQAEHERAVFALVDAEQDFLRALYAVPLRFPTTLSEE